ncbi:MAG: ABC transporter ATP-binding protein [Ruminococcus sp.]|nr:ABC transporter ATP-binding protein [Ruminococcus sp.]
MIEIKDLNLTLGNNKVLDNISLNVEKGSVFGFLGSNGAGKSTLMRCICGVYKPTSGSVSIDGQEVYDNAEAKAKIFFVNDETIQYTSFTLGQLKEYYKSYYVDFSEETFERLLSKVSLPLDKKLSSFSKGMKRQAIVIIALACKTDYLMLDEAFDGLDPAMRMAVKNMITDELCDRDAAVIVSSHNIAEISEICDRAMMIYGGKLLFSDELDNITGGFCKLQLVFKGDVPAESSIKLAVPGVMKISASGSIVTIITADSEEEARAQAAALSPDMVESVPLTLEEVFIYEMEARGYAGFMGEIEE